MDVYYKRPKHIRNRYHWDDARKEDFERSANEVVVEQWSRDRVHV
jgi:hypothetical protein